VDSGENKRQEMRINRQLLKSVTKRKL